MYKIDEKGINLIKSFEGLALYKKDENMIYPYICPAGIKTIGYGHTSSFIQNKDIFGSGITIETCEELLQNDLQKIANFIIRVVSAPITINQFSALLSFCFNLGIGTFKISNLRKIINKNPIDLMAIEKEFNKWVFANGRKMPGLIKRRKAEFNLYKSYI